MMRELKSYIYRIYLNKIQKEKFESLYQKNLFLFNRLIDEKNKRISSSLDEAIFVKHFVKQFKELDHGSFISYISTYKIVNKLFDRYHENKLTPLYRNSLKYPRKIHFDVFFTNVKYSKNRISIPHLGTFKARIHRDLPINCMIHSSIIEERTKDVFFINFLVETKVEYQKMIPQNAIGFDYSVPHLFCSSENDWGDEFKVRNFNQTKINKIKRKMAKCVFNSKNYLKLKTKEEKLYNEVARKRDYMLHNLSLNCVKKFDVIGVETLDLEEMASKNHLGKGIYEDAFNKFCKYLSYKSLKYGKYFIKVPKYFPSTRMCSQCGVVHGKMELDERSFKCDCGLLINRDLNAAINIREKALSILKDEKDQQKIRRSIRCFN